MSSFDKTTNLSYIQQIEFLLKAEGINLVEREKRDNVKYYFPRSKKYSAKVYFQDGSFVVEEGSLIQKPKEGLKNWSDEGRLYQKLTKDINLMIAKGIIENLGDTYKTLVKVPFPSVSAAAGFISGTAQNGWTFFKDIQELRNEG